MGGGKEAKRKRALARSGLDPEVAKKKAAKEFAEVREKQRKIEEEAAVIKSENKKANKKLYRARREEKRREAGEVVVRKKKKKEEEDADGVEKTKKKRRRAPAEAEDGDEASTATRQRVRDPTFRVFVGQLPFTADAESLRAHFVTSGIPKVGAVRILTEKGTNQSKGIAFVQLASEDDLLKALDLHQSDFGGRWINVERSTGQKGSSAPDSGDGPDKPKVVRRLSVFVAQLPYSATPTTVREFFEANGVEGVESVKMTSERGTNKKGMAFVQLKDEAAVLAALELHEAEFGGRSINVERSSAKKKKEAHQDEDEYGEGH